jgi:hypothetical protein
LRKIRIFSSAHNGAIGKTVHMRGCLGSEEGHCYLSVMRSAAAAPGRSAYHAMPW